MSLKSKDFERKVQELGDNLKKYDKKSNEKCLPTIYIAALLAPIAIWLALYFIQPSFVLHHEGEKKSRDKAKIFKWTIGLTLVSWAAMYAFSYYKGYNKVAMICSRDS